jgi:hypothetical protein
MVYKFRTTGPWGPGLGYDLNPEDVDGNFWQAIQDIQAKSAQGVGISNITVHGNQFSVVLTDHSILGPYTMPMMTLTFKGTWQPNFSYSAGDIITYGGSTYMVRANHLSAATFDPGANDGHGTDYYGLLLSNPACTLPSGGPVGNFLRKAGVGDYVTQWQTAALHDLSDVSLPQSPPPASGNVLTYESGLWVARSGITALADLSDVNISSPANNDVLQYNGSNWFNGPAPSKRINSSVSSTTLDTSAYDIFNITPSSGNTWVTSILVPGQEITLIFTTSGTSSYNQVFGSGLKSQGTLATGTVDSKVFTVTFLADNSSYNEICRTTAM